jgi:hypothetical protein
MWPYSAFGVLSDERVSKRLTSLRRRFTTTEGTLASTAVTPSMCPAGP